MRTQDIRLFLGGIVGGVALGFLALQAMSQVASGAASLVGVGLLVVFGVGWLVAPLIGWMKGMPTFAAGWSASGVVLAVGVLLRLLTTGTP